MYFLDRNTLSYASILDDDLASLSLNLAIEGLLELFLHLALLTLLFLDKLFLSFLVELGGILRLFLLSFVV